MIMHPRWAHGVRHRGAAAETFLTTHLGEQHRQIVLVGGAGFDPRAPIVSERLGVLATGRIRGLFLREERPNPPAEQVQRAEEHGARMQAAIRDSAVQAIPVFATGSMAVTGGREAVRALASIDLADATDIVLDVSALSIGVAFPLTRYLLETLDQALSPANLHVVVVDDPATDAAISPISGDSVETMPGFKGNFGLDQSFGAARLWLPQLGRGLGTTLARIHDFVEPDAVAPILPFPSAHPRHADELIEEYGSAFESEWEVDARDIIYADERLPLDLYRTILRLGDRRQRVFEGAGGSLLVLSPVGSKVLSLGALLAAIERDFPVVYLEPIGYAVDMVELGSTRPRIDELVHLWLRGEADPCPEGRGRM